MTSTDMESLGAALSAGLCLVVVVTLLRHRRVDEELGIAEPASPVRLLATPDELLEAAERAAAFEEGLSGSLALRVQRYRELRRALLAPVSASPGSPEEVRSAS